MILTDAQIEELEKQVACNKELGVLYANDFNGNEVRDLLDTIRHLKEELRKNK